MGSEMCIRDSSNTSWESDGYDSATTIAIVVVIGVVLLLGAVVAVVLFKRANRSASAAGQTRPAVENQMYSEPQRPANGTTPDHFC